MLWSVVCFGNWSPGGVTDAAWRTTFRFCIFLVLNVTGAGYGRLPWNGVEWTRVVSVEWTMAAHAGRALCVVIVIALATARLLQGPISWQSRTDSSRGHRSTEAGAYSNSESRPQTAW